MIDWQDVLEVWFGELDENGIPDKFHRNRWFRSDKAFDQELRRRFLSLLLIASEDGLRHWRDCGEGRLAEILLLDQFSRNIYRGGMLAFANDGVGQKLCHEGVRVGADVGLPAIYRAFFYMPLHHSERLSDQEAAVELYQQLLAVERGVLRPLLEGFLESAKGHCELIRRYGRFPHRNRVLGRASTRDEMDYLDKGAGRFGQ